MRGAADWSNLEHSRRLALLPRSARDAQAAPQAALKLRANVARAALKQRLRGARYAPERRSRGVGAAPRTAACAPRTRAALERRQSGA